MKVKNKNYIKRNLFDFEIGHLKKSPCLGCEKQKTMPLCIKDCEKLDFIQRELAAGISLSLKDDG